MGEEAGDKVGFERRGEHKMAQGETAGREEVKRKVKVKRRTTGILTKDRKNEEIK